MNSTIISPPMSISDSFTYRPRGMDRRCLIGKKTSDLIEVRAIKVHVHKVSKVRVFKGNKFMTIMEPNGTFTVAKGKYIFEGHKIGEGWEIVEKKS